MVIKEIRWLQNNKFIVRPDSEFGANWLVNVPFLIHPQFTDKLEFL